MNDFDAPSWREDSSEPGYTGRSLTHQTVTSIKHGAITGSSGWTALAPKEVLDLLQVGDWYEVETVNFSLITGWRVNGQWYNRKSDDDLERQRRADSEKWEQEKRDRLAKERENYARREAALPEYMRARLQSFHEQGGENFRLDGWSYELAIAELVPLYVAGDEEAINEYARVEGTTGNQHDFAKALAKAHLEGQRLNGTVGGLSPLSGDPFYRGKK